MKTDDFEKRLQRQPLREIPAGWRREILARARQALPAPVPGHHASRVIPFLSSLNQQLSTLLWPHPRAWAGLAAAWVVILAANVACRDDATAAARRVVPPSPQIREMLREQEQLLVELCGSPAADRPKALPPRPQSLYRNESFNA